MGAVAAPLAPPAFRGDAAEPIPPLENGDRLTAREFLRRYLAMPHVRKAELIHGIVYMGSPVRLDRHGEPDNLIQTWLGSYSIATPGVRAAANSTTRLGPDDVPQPDALLRILPECGGQSRLDAAGYLLGAPELVVEIAASSVSLDDGDKLVAYRPPACGNTSSGARTTARWTGGSSRTRNFVRCRRTPPASCAAVFFPASGWMCRPCWPGTGRA